MFDNSSRQESYSAPVCDVLAVEQQGIACTSGKGGGFDDYGVGEYEWN